MYQEPSAGPEGPVPEEPVPALKDLHALVEVNVFVDAFKTQLVQGPC